MGVDTKLYISAKWDLDDIRVVLERTQQSKVEIEAATSMPNAYKINVIDKGRSIFCITPTNTPIGIATYLSLRSNDEAIQMFKDVAGIFGGLLNKTDTNSNFEWIQGICSAEDGLSYFVKYALVNDGINQHDLQGLIDSINNWYKTVDSRDRSGLRVLANKLASKNNSEE